MTLLERCPHFRDVLREGFHCNLAHQCDINYLWILQLQMDLVQDCREWADCGSELSEEEGRGREKRNRGRENRLHVYNITALCYLNSQFGSKSCAHTTMLYVILNCKLNYSCSRLPKNVLLVLNENVPQEDRNSSLVS